MITVKKHMNNTMEMPSTVLVHGSLFVLIFLAFPRNSFFKNYRP